MSTLYRLRRDDQRFNPPGDFYRTGEEGGMMDAEKLSTVLLMVLVILLTMNTYFPVKKLEKAPGIIIIVIASLTLIATILT